MLVCPACSSIISTEAPICRASRRHRRMVSGSPVYMAECFPSMSFAAMTTSGTLSSSTLGRAASRSSVELLREPQTCDPDDRVIVGHITSSFDTLP